MKIRVDSTEYVYGTVTGDHDLIGTTVEVSLPPEGTPPTVWYDAEVQDVTENLVDGVPTSWTLTFRLLVGPQGAVTLDVGDFDWTFRLSDSPEELVRRSGQLQVTLI